MRSSLTGLFCICATVLAQSWDENEAYRRDISDDWGHAFENTMLANRDDHIDLDDVLEARDFNSYDHGAFIIEERDFDADTVISIDGALKSRRDLGSDEDDPFTITTRSNGEDDTVSFHMLWTREPKKKKDNWEPPKVNILPGTKVIKNTFKCKKKKHTCSGEIQLGPSTVPGGTAPGVKPAEPAPPAGS